jgi:hypothetical protein
MLPHKHLAISAVIGAGGWLVTGDVVAAIAALTAGVLPDLDHAVDYTYYHRTGEHRMILPLHGYEYVLVGAAAALMLASPVLWVAAFSYLVHLLADQAENKTQPLAYSLLYRAWHGFRLENLSTVPEAAKRGRDDDLRALANLVARLRGVCR